MVAVDTELKGSQSLRDRIQTVLPFQSAIVSSLHNCCDEFFPQVTECFSSSNPSFAPSLVRACVTHTNILFQIVC